MTSRVELLRVSITTGSIGHDRSVTIRVNNGDHSLNRISGGTGPGESYEGEFFVGCAAEECLLLAPESDRWEIKSLAVDLEHDNGQSTHRVFGPVDLAPGAALDILHAPA